jgi:hypothetical protein
MIRIRKQYEIRKWKTITIHYPGNNAFHVPPVPPAQNRSHYLKHHSRLHSYPSLAMSTLEAWLISRKPVGMNCVHRVEVGLAPCNDTLVHHTV